jgi:hypothetical protein
MKFFYCKTDTASETVYWIYAKIIQNGFNHFQIESGSFETLIKLADEGLGTTLLPYLHLRFKRIRQKKLRHLQNQNQLIVSLIFPRANWKCTYWSITSQYRRVIKEQLFSKRTNVSPLKTNKKKEHHVMFLFFLYRMNGRCNFSFWLEKYYIINLSNTFFKCLLKKLN